MLCRLCRVLPGMTCSTWTGPYIERMLWISASSGMPLFFLSADNNVVDTVTVLRTVTGVGVTVTLKKDMQSAVPFLFPDGSFWTAGDGSVSPERGSSVTFVGAYREDSYCLSRR